MVDTFEKKIDGVDFRFRIPHCRNAGDHAHVMVDKLDVDGKPQWTARIDLIGSWAGSRGRYCMPVELKSTPLSSVERQAAEKAVTLFYNKCRKAWKAEHAGTELEHSFLYEHTKLPAHLQRPTSRSA